MKTFPLFGFNEYRNTGLIENPKMVIKRAQIGL